jgi:calcineurin-like phosphoesterase family protein
MWWFTSDLHLGHKNILRAGHRPEFETTAEMDDHLISQWNNTINPKKDVIVFLGDLTLNSTKVANLYKEQLTGNIIWVKGNHDHWQGGHRFEWHKKVYNTVIYGTHFPLRTWTQSDYRWNLHGHSHGTLAPLYNQLDCGVDNAKRILGEYRPFSFDEVDTIMRSRAYTNSEEREIRTYGY